jgi:hypothetical protein
MSAVSVYRALIALRACWFIVGWLFGWGLSEHTRSFISLHPYASLFGQALGLAVVLAIFAGLWFFQRWARLLFVIALVASVIYGAVRVHEPRSMPPAFVAPLMWLVVMVNGAIVAMSFLPPVRGLYASKT